MAAGFNPEGRGAGIFVQMNWSCGAGGAAKCNEDTSLRVDGPHKTQQSLLSVLIAEVGDKVFFEEGPLVPTRTLFWFKFRTSYAR